MENYNIFHMKVENKDGQTFELAKTCNNEVVVNIGDLYGLKFCEVDEFNYYCSKKAGEIRKGDLIALDGVELKVLDLDTETHEENIRGWEYAEMMELAYFD